MTDDLTPDWRVQASFKFGPGAIHMLNVRADDFVELGGLLEAVPASLADKLANAQQALRVAGAVAEGTEGTVTTVSTSDTQAAAPQSNGSGAPRCAHGDRKYFAKGNWEAFFCPQPKEAKNKCDPIFKGDDNRNEPYWP